jgi:microcystin degradation protein MlrC
LATSLFPVQPWLDVEEMGCAVVVVGTDDAAAREEADRLAALFWDKRREFQVRLYTVGEIVKLADERRAGDPPFVISDSADSPGAGATGDSNFVLKELLAYGAHRRHRCLLTIVDAPAVAQAAVAGVGNEVTLQVGYTLNRNGRYGAPIEITGTVRRVGDGVFRIGGGYAENTVASMGRCAVVEIGKLSLLVTERPTFSGDPAMYRCVGLEPAQADLVLVKSANQFRAEYEKLTNRIFILDTPGISPAHLARLRFDKIRRPFYPFDDNFEWRIDS